MTAEPFSPVHRLVRKIFQLNDLLKAVGNEITRPAKQTGARWPILNALEAGPQTVAAIARSKHTSRQSTQRIVDQLVSDGIVRLRANPAHQRFPLVQMTSQGRRALLEIRASQREWEAEIVAKLGGQIDKGCLLFLDRFLAAVRQTIPEGAAD